LDRVTDETDPDSLTAVAVAHPIVGAGEADRPVGVDDAQDLAALGRSRGTRDFGAPIHLVVVID
jgi:hypothetical protein